VALTALIAVSAIRAQTAPAPAAAATAQSGTPAAVSGPEQPIAFSHKIHAGTLQMPCEFCHAESRSGQALLIPQAAKCMTCHQTVATTSPEVQKLAAYAKADGAIPWIRVYELPSFVTFSHKVHLEHGNTCQECHGQVAQRDRLFRETDISMAGCINCHTAKKASVDCNTCHMLDQ
jgi:hypothetical protein